MANKVKSRWTVTFDKDGPDELVLCSAGDFIANVLAFGGEQVVEDGDYIEADESEPLAFGNVKRPQKLIVHKEHADRETALEWCLEQDTAIPVNITAPLTVEIQGGDTYVYATCAIQRWNFVPLPGGPHRTESTFELKCGALTLGTPAGPAPAGLETAAVTMSRRDGLLDALGTEPDHLEAAAEWENAGTHGSTAAQATAGSRPTTLKGEGLYLPGVSGNGVSVANHATLQPGANFSIRWDGTLTDYTPAARMCLASKWDSASNRRSWALYLETDGKVSLQVSTDGTAGTVTTWTSALPTGMPAGERCGIQVIKAGTVLSFYLYPEQDFQNGILFSPAQTVSNLTAYATTSDVWLGSINGGTTDLLAGITERLQFWNTSTWFVTSTLLLIDYTFTDTWVHPVTPVLSRASTTPAFIVEGPIPRFDGADDSFAFTAPLPLNAVAGVTLVWLGMLNRVTGTNDLIFCGTNAANPRVCLRVDGGDVKLLVRRLDGEATATITAAGAVTQFFFQSISASIDYAAGTATIYVAGAAVAAGALTSAGVTSATNSSETRIMAGQGGANPAAGEVNHVLILDEATSPFEHAQWLAAVLAESSLDI
jgi:hypothetical protein